MSFLQLKLCKCSQARTNPISDALDLEELLPSSYQYNLCDYENVENGFISRFRVNISNKEDAVLWLEELSYLSCITYRTDKVFPESTIGNVYKISKYCHHRTKSYSSQQKNSKRNTNCTARIVFTVKQKSVSRKYKSKDVHLHEFPAIVVLHHTHNHSINSAFALRYRKPVTEIREKYWKMFIAGLTPRKAFQKFSTELLETCGNQYNIVAADRALNPDIRWVYHLFRTFKKEFSDTGGENMLNPLEELVSDHNVQQDANFYFDDTYIKEETININEESHLELSAASDVDDTTDIVQELESVFKEIVEKVRKNPDIVDAGKEFIKSAKNLKTDNALKFALSTFGKYGECPSRKKLRLSSKRMGVQSTAILRGKVKRGGRLTTKAEPAKQTNTIEHGYSKQKEFYFLISKKNNENSWKNS